MHLLASGIPYRDESTYGFLHRTATANGYINTRTFLSAQTPAASINAAVLNIDCFTSGSGKILHGNLDKQFVYKLSRLEKPTLQFRKVHIDRKLLRTKERHLCTDCIAEKGFSSYLWDYELITSCIIHNRQLASKCNHCKHPFSWDETTSLGCDCEGSARKIKLSADEQAYQTKLTSWLKSGTQSKITDVESIYFSLKQIHVVLGEKISKRKLVMLSIKSLSDKESFFNDMVPLLNASKLLNRIKLYPLLASNDKTSKALGHELLNQLTPSNLTDTVSVPRLELTIAEAAVILNISKGQLSQFLEKKLLSNQSLHYSSKQLIKLSWVYKLLLKLDSLKKDSDAESLCINTVVKNPNYHLPLACIVLDLLDGKNLITDLNIDKGLLGIRLCMRKMTSDLVQCSRDFLSLKEAAKQFSHAEHYLLYLADTAYLKVTKAVGNTNKLLFERKDMVKFDSLYTIGPELANNASLSPTTFCLKLIAYGIEAIAGPSIDGSKIYLFRKADLVNLDIKAVENTTISHLPNRPGRPASGDNRHKDLVPFDLIKKEFNLTTLKLRNLIGKRILKKHPDHWHKALVTRESYEALKSKVKSSNYLSLDAALKKLGMTQNAFKTKFVQTRQCMIEDLYIAKVIKNEDFEHIEKLHNTYLTSAEADVLFPNPRKRINNLQKQGLIKPAMQLKGWHTSINLWDRNQVLNLLEIC